MAHYFIEMRGQSPVSFELLRQQRDTLNGIMLGTDYTVPRFLSPDQEKALTGIVMLLDGMIETHDQTCEDCGYEGEKECPDCITADMIDAGNRVEGMKAAGMIPPETHDQGTPETALEQGFEGDVGLLSAAAIAVLDLVESEGRDTGLGDAFSDLRDVLGQ